MDFVAVVLVLALYFVRPQDWVPGMAGFEILKPTMAFSLITMYLAADRNNKRIQLLKTPHDWLMLAYLIYVVAWSPTPSDTFKDCISLFAFYLVTVQALNSPDRIQRYLKYWLWCLVFVAGAAMLSLIGLDLTGARAVTEANEGRLSLGTWIHNNPNALGHTVLTAIPLAWMLYCYRRPVDLKLLGLLVIALAVACIFKTESRGAYMAALATILLTALFGRSKLVQVLGVVMALAAGGAALSLMPRFQEEGMRDAGVIGRLLAWESARTASKTYPTGYGWKQFQPIIKWGKLTLPKATHSSYVRVGADLGYPGLFLYSALLWCGLRAIMRTPPEDSEVTAIRTCIFSLLVATAISGWMIDRAYHTEFFLLMAMLAALERLYAQKPPEEEPAEEAAPTFSWMQPAFATQPPDAPGWSPSAMAATGGAIRVRSLPTALDLAMAGVGVYAILYFWDYQLRTL